MSHFVIIVTGPDIETALAPYDENERVPEYRDSDGDTTTYNPKSKWDWYQVGGRWGGYFLLKNGQRVDTCRWGDVDTESLGKEAEALARADFERWERAFKAQEGTRPEAWTTVLERALKDQPPETHRELVDKAREVYGAQPAIVAYRKIMAGEFYVHDPVETFGFELDPYIAQQRLGAIIPFAILHNGEWIERGKMGWFASVADEKPAINWFTEASKILASLDPDTIVTAVDCHI